MTAPTGVSVVVLAGLIVLCGHFVKGVSGFGSALFSVPLLLFILDVKFVTPLFLAFDFASGAILVAANWRSIHRRLFLLLLCGMLVGSAIGTWVLVSFTHSLLKRVLGLLVTAWALAMFLRRRTDTAPVRRRPVASYLAPLSGVLGGTLGALFSINGPPVIIYLSHALEEKQVFRATLYGIFFADACYRLALFTVTGLLTRRVLRFALLMAPFLLAGIFAGSWLQTRIDERLFGKIVAVILMATGVMLMV